MDEATSHLDEENEKLINRAISGLDMTRIIIAHRPSTIASADRVICLGTDHSPEHSNEGHESKGIHL